MGTHKDSHTNQACLETPMATKKNQQSPLQAMIKSQNFKLNSIVKFFFLSFFLNL